MATTTAVKKVVVKDIMAVSGVLGSLMNKPQLVYNDNFPISADDFPDRLHKIIYGAINQLAKQGSNYIDAAEIDNYLQKYPQPYQVFNDNAGVQVVDKILEMAETVNFEFYYTTLKKCSLLTRLSADGYDITPFWNPEDLSVEKVQKAQTKFDTSSLDEILDYYEVRLNTIRTDYRSNAAIKEAHISDGIRDTLASLAEKPIMGLPMNSAKMNTICHGRRPGTVYLKSAASGTGKSRYSLAEACRSSLIKIFDLEKRRWLKNPSSVPVLFISTEVTKEEVQTMVLAYASGVPEDHIIDSKMTKEEQARVNTAANYIEQSPLHFVYIANFTISDIEGIIKRHVYEKKIQICYFDYLFSSAKAFSEMSSKAKGFTLREDQNLMVMAQGLKDIANKYKINIDTSTQTNDSVKSSPDPDASTIRGAKAIADKVDIGFVMYEPHERDREAIHTILAKKGMGFTQEPNIVLSIYKVRRGAYNAIKLFIYFDKGTLRMTDLFVTDRAYKLLDVQGTDIQALFDDTDITAEVQKAEPSSNFIFGEVSRNNF